MDETGKISLIRTAVAGISPILKRFYKFTRDMAQQFSRHLSKDRTDEFVEAVKKELR